MLLHAVHTFGVSVLYVHAIFDAKHVMRARVYPNLANFYICINSHYQILFSRFSGVHSNMVCINVRVLNIL